MFIFLLAFASTVNAEPKANKKNTSAASTKEESGLQTKKYTDVQIDISLEKLPSNYYGNEPKSIYFAIQKIKKSAVKGEFETTEQFQKRIESENKRPIIGKISPDGFFSFQANGPEIKYSADETELSIHINLERLPQPHWYLLEKIKDHNYKSDKFNENAKSISLTSSRVGNRKYIGENSYGATTEVEENNYESYYLAVGNYKDFPFKETLSSFAQEQIKRYKKLELNYPISDYDKEWHMFAKFKASVNEAKTIKDSLKVILIVKLDDLPTYEDFAYRKATIDNPSEYTNVSRYIFVNLEEIWMYNQTTGHIYLKIKRQ